MMMTKFTIQDPYTGEETEVDGIVVSCSTPGCSNEGVDIELPDVTAIQCGPCGEWIVPPMPPAEEPVPPAE